MSQRLRAQVGRRQPKESSGGAMGAVAQPVDQVPGVVREDACRDWSSWQHRLGTMRQAFALTAFELSVSGGSTL
jgi:hypothetical protein